jgi:uncharacterized membrane protein
MSDSIRPQPLASTLKGSLILPPILLLAALLRMIYIGNHSFWLDELFSLKFASYSLPALFREVANFDNHPPTYYLLLHVWIQLFGDSELSLRTPSAIFSVLSVYFTFRVGELLFDRRVASIAALLLALSGFSIYYAQEARMYSLLALASVLSVYLLLRFLEQQSSRTLFHYVWSTTLLVYTHLYGLFIILAENIYILAVLYRFGNRMPGVSLKIWLRVQGIIFALSLPWLGSLINRILNFAQEGFWVAVPTADSIVRTFAAFSGTSGGLALWILLMVLGAGSGLAAKTGFRRKLFKEQSTKDEGWHILLLLLLLFTPILVPYLISHFITPIYIIRCTIAGQFAFYLLVAKGIASVRWPVLSAPALILVLAVLLRPLLKEGYVHRNAADFRGGVVYLVANVSEEDKIILCSHGHLNWPFQYYAEKQGLRSEILRIGSNDAVSGLLNGHRGWYVGLSDRKDQCQRLLRDLSNEFTHLELRDISARNIDMTVFIDDR